MFISRVYGLKEESIELKVEWLDWKQHQMMIAIILSKKLLMLSYFKISHRIDYMKDFENEITSMKNENELNQLIKHR